MIKEKAYAKVNLTLEVKGKRLDGFHEIDTIMVPIDLFDELTFEVIDQGIILEPSFLDIRLEENFIYKAATLFFNTYQVKKGVKITVTKNIPKEAGLAGGSADASATLRGLNRVFNLGINIHELAHLSSQLGSDMPYCIYQKASRCSGRGEIVSFLDINYNPIPITIIKPAYGLSTKEVYENYQNIINDNSSKFINVIKGLKNNDVNLIAANIFNDLLISSQTIKEDFSNLYFNLNKNNKFFMSGSGPTLYAFGHLDVAVDELLVIKTFII